MPPQPTPDQPVIPILAILTTMLRTTLEALPVNPNATAEETAVLRQFVEYALTELAPCTAQQAMLASRIVSADFAVMECFRRAMLPDLPHNHVARYQANVVRLARLADTTRRELRMLQAEQRAEATPTQPKATAAPAAVRPPEPQPRPAAAAPIERRHPMPSGNDDARNSGDDMPQRRHPMPSGAAPLPPHSAIELPPAPPHPDDVLLAEVVAQRRAAGVNGAKVPAI